MLYFDTASTAVKYCNGTSWVLTSSGGGSGSVNSGTQYQIGYYAATGTVISGDANITTDASNNLIISGTNSTLAIGTNTVTNAVNIIGTSAETIGMVRGTSVGNNLTIAAGGGLSGGTNKNGGILILSSGITTGTGSSNIQFLTYPTGSTGASDNTALTAPTLSATGATGTTAATTLQGNAGSGSNQNGGTLTLASGVSTGTGSSGMNFNVYTAGTSGSTANSPTTAVTIASTGFVGIGSSSPQGTLDVEGGTAANGNGTNINIYAQNGTASTSHNGGSIILMPGLKGGGGGSLNGNVGIGTTVPMYPLHVQNIINPSISICTL